MILEELNKVDIVLLSALAAMFVAQVYWYSRYLAAPARKLRKGTKDKVQSTKEDECPGVTVVLCAHNERENLSNYLQALLTQDYPAYEVIVVDDGSEDDTRAVIETYMTRDERLHMTFVPYGARVGSTKKLALTLAAKAAQYDYLLLTDADCCPESDQWIRRMMEAFEPSDIENRPKDIVLGFGPYFETEGHVNRLVRFDTLFNGLHYLGAALCGHPYMGVGRNLAYRKSMFFESGGFTHLMTNRAGDDDLFVNHVATRENTAVVLSRDSYTWSPAKESLREWWQQKRRHLSVSPAYREETKIRLALEPLSRGLFYALVVGIIVYQSSLLTDQFSDLTTNDSLLTTLLSVVLWPLYMAVGLFLIRWILQTAILNVSARRMGLRRFNMFTVLWFDIVLPLINLWMLIVPEKDNKKW